MESRLAVQIFASIELGVWTLLLLALLILGVAAKGQGHNGTSSRSDSEAYGGIVLILITAAPTVVVLVAATYRSRSSLQIGTVFRSLFAAVSVFIFIGLLAESFQSDDKTCFVALILLVIYFIWTVCTLRVTDNYYVELTGRRLGCFGWCNDKVEPQNVLVYPFANPPLLTQPMYVPAYATFQFYPTEVQSPGLSTTQQQQILMQHQQIILMQPQQQNYEELELT